MKLAMDDKKVYRALCAYAPRIYRQERVYEDELRKNDFAILILESSEELIKNKKNYKIIPFGLEMEKNEKVNVYGYPYDLS